MSRGYITASLMRGEEKCNRNTYQLKAREREAIQQLVPKGALSGAVLFTAAKCKRPANMNTS